jgi:hypothetical protein
MVTSESFKEIQEKYKNQNLDATKSWKQESNRLMQ